MRIFTEVESGREGTDSVLVDEISRINLNLSGIRAVLAIGSARGGVGKSAITVNVAATLAVAGRKVGIIDADLNSPSIVAMLGMDSKRRGLAIEGIDPAAGPLGLRIAASILLSEGESPPVSFLDLDAERTPSQLNGSRLSEISYGGSLRRLLGQSRFGALDLLMVDLAPGLEQVYRFSTLLPRAAVIMVSQPSELGARAARSALDLVSHSSSTVLGVIENMAGFNCDGCHSVRPLLPAGSLATVARESGVAVLERLPFDPRLAEACDRGVLFVRAYPDTPLAKRLTALAHTIDDALAGVSNRNSAPE